VDVCLGFSSIFKKTSFLGEKRKKITRFQKQTRARAVRERERERKRKKERKKASDVFDDASARAKRRREKFMGRHREERRNLFQKHFAEIEPNRYKIPVRREQ
jgi:hypothetical protein